MLGQGCGHHGAILIVVGPMIISHKTICEKYLQSFSFIYAVHYADTEEKNYKAELLTGNLVIILYLQNKSFLYLLSFLKNHTIT